MFRELGDLIEKLAKFIKFSNADSVSVVEDFRAITSWNLKIFDLVFDYILPSLELSIKISLVSEKCSRISMLLLLYELSSEVF